MGLRVDHAGKGPPLARSAIIVENAYCRSGNDLFYDPKALVNHQVRQGWVGEPRVLPSSHIVDIRQEGKGSASGTAWRASSSRRPGSASTDAGKSVEIAD